MWEKHISMACLLGSGLNNIFLWKAHLLILFKSLLSCISEKVSSLTFDKSDVSSANILHIDSISLGKSLIQSAKLRQMFLKYQGRSFLYRTEDYSQNVCRFHA